MTNSFLPGNVLVASQQLIKKAVLAMENSAGLSHITYLFERVIIEESQVHLLKYDSKKLTLNAVVYHYCIECQSFLIRCYIWIHMYIQFKAMLKV